MTDDTPSGCLPLVKVVFNGFVTFAIDARVLHKALQIAGEFCDWINGCIDSYKFQENQDFIKREHWAVGHDARNGIDYLLVLDTAKQIAHFATGPARNLVRRWLIEAEQKTVFGLIAEHRLSFDRPLDEIVEVATQRIVKAILPSLIDSIIADKRIQTRYGKTSGQIWKDKGFPPINANVWFGNRLQEAGCQIPGYGQLGNTRARLFDPDRADRWLAAGGRRIVELKIEERMGQASFSFVFPGRHAA